ncbi:MAG TPA: hypothetical protein VGR61_06805 [Candidatus Dormibacteraeota bacterium]|nr:hypothetical protein [Candidatus Dormibacteraeota bacterium]
MALRSMFRSPATDAGGSPGASRRCTPMPCANPHDFELYLDRSTARPGDGRLLRLSARFVNGHNDPTSVNGNQNRADLLDFQVRDSQGRQSKPVFDAPGCGHWDSSEIPYPQSLGPKPICFRPDGPPPLTVVWGPDLGLLFDDVRIPLPATWTAPSG